MAIAADVEFSGLPISLESGGPSHRQYRVIAESLPARISLGGAVATVVQVADIQVADVQVLPAVHKFQYAVFDGGERAAFDMAISVLQGLADNEGLAMRVLEA